MLFVVGFVELLDNWKMPVFISFLKGYEILVCFYVCSYTF